MSPFVVKFVSSAASATLISVSVPLIIRWTLRRRKEEASLKDGWFYLEPGPMAWFVLVLSSLFVGLTLAIVIIELLSGTRPTFDAHSILSIGVILIFIVGFGALTIAACFSCFHTRIRWNAEVVEKIMYRGTKRIAWKDVQLYGYDPVLGYFWILSQDEYLRIEHSMHGLKQLLVKLAGEEKGGQLYQRSIQRP
jgi:hypothetical protein